jgi:hypothetical protein
MLDLKAICEALGWQGGTTHQAIAGIKAVCAERDELREQKQLLIEAQLDEISENLRLRDLAVANEDENITAVIERVIRERDELRTRLAELERQEPVAFRERLTGRLAAEGDEHRDRFTMAYAPLYARPVPAIPEGWRLVPVEPTPEMLGAVVSSMDDFLLGDGAENQYRADWAAMLAAAPEAAR